MGGPWLGFGTIAGLAWLPDGGRIATVGSGGVHVVRLSDGEITRVGPRVALHALALEPGTECALTRDERGRVERWNLATGARERLEGVDVDAGFFARDGFVVTGGRTAVERITVARGRREVIGRHEKDVRAVAGSAAPSRCWAISGPEDGSVKVWNVAQGTCVGSISGDGEPVADGELVADWTVCPHVADPDLQRSHHLDSVSFSRDGRWLVVGAQEGKVRVYRFPEGECARELPGWFALCWGSERVACRARRAGGEVYALADDGSGWRFDGLAQHGYRAMRVDQRGRTLAALGHDGVACWHARADGLERVAELRVAGAIGLAVAPDGEHVAVGHIDGTIECVAIGAAGAE